MFYLVGIGLGDARDITVKGLDIVKSASRVYLESYTSILSVGKEELEKFYGRELVLADRDLVEQGSEEILRGADTEDVALLVVGDPYSATTHTDLVLRAKQADIPTQVVHNASIMNAVGCSGLQLYSFGETVSIPFWTESWRPDSFFDKILSNRQRGLHTLCLLDIKVKEPTPESLTRKRKEYMPPQFMSASVAARQILDIIHSRPEDDQQLLSGDSLCVSLARVGSPEQRIIACSLLDTAGRSDELLGPPLHSLVIPSSTLHPVETEFLQLYTTTTTTAPPSRP